MQGLHQTGRGKLLERAKKFIFSTALPDSASKLCRLNFRYGLAKMHLVQERLGMDPTTSFIAAPDCTISRNLHRWRNGIGYGGKITWGDGKEPLIFVDTMPNACGMLVGSLDEIPDPIELIQRLHDMNESSGEFKIDGIPIHWNYGTGNHFINVFELFPNPAVSDSIDLPQYAFIVHSSPAELKDDNNNRNLGMYYHMSENLRFFSDTLETPFGDVHYLVGGNALNYYDFYKWANEFGRKRRYLTGELLFGKNFKLVTDKTHQGMTHMNEVALGCHVFNNSEKELFPLTLRADLPCYLMKGVPNIHEEAMEKLNFTGRSTKYGLDERLKTANILPHGGGYTFPHIISVPEIFETVEKRRYFSVDLGTGIGTLIFETPRELEFAYRGRNVLVQTIDLGLGEIVARMIPHFALKI